MRYSALFSWALILIILGVWESACRGFNVPDFILPTPSAIITVAVLQAPMLLPHAGTMALEVLVGICGPSSLLEDFAGVTLPALLTLSLLDYARRHTDAA